MTNITNNNLYNTWFYITENIWNNSLSFDKINWKKIYIPSLVKISGFDEIKLLEKNSDKITFQDFWFDDKLSINFWLENFYETTPSPSLLRRGITAPIYLFDNHNHSLYFWYLAKEKKLIQEKNNILYHIDEHADYRDPWVVLEKTDLQSIFNYTNFSDINVWNYIIPAEKEWLIWKTIQIRWTSELESYVETHCMCLWKTNEGVKNNQNRDRFNLSLQNDKESIILNLDLDFFQPDLDFIDYELKKKVILDIAKKASVITVSTSPFFIDQKLALKVFKDLFS